MRLQTCLALSVERSPRWPDIGGACRSVLEPIFMPQTIRANTAKQLSFGIGMTDEEGKPSAGTGF
jgi:hypothetical protein